jgi:hypothetical protein
MSAALVAGGVTAGGGATALIVRRILRAMKMRGKNS